MVHHCMTVLIVSSLHLLLWTYAGSVIILSSLPLGPAVANISSCTHTQLAEVPVSTT